MGGNFVDRKFFDWKIIIIYILIFAIFILSSVTFNHAATAFSNNMTARQTVIIDAGHGGVDGGAVSCTGVYESNINLDIALRLNDLLHLLGIQTVMIRDTDRSVYTTGDTIAAKKVSDIKERIRVVNSTPNAILVSIHQNNFHDSRYWGTQVFYNKQSGSDQIAELLQESFRTNLNPENNRQIKKSSGVYLMEHVNCQAVLVECGFLSNPSEEQMLRNDGYQRNISSIIATTVSQYLNT